MEQRKIIFLDVDGTLVDYSGHIPQSAAEAVRLARQKGHKVYICTGRSRAEVYPEIWEMFPELKAGTWGGAGETALFGDLALKEIDKAYAMDVLLEHLHASPDATVAFGDAKVDIPMLEYSRIGVAMGNGGPEIRAAADYVTDDVECDGLWKAFSHLGLLE